MDSKSGSGAIVTRERGITTTIENPFTLKVGQVFTGFGVGCGIGIGVGRPLNLAAIPVLNQVMVATRGATDAFSGFGRSFNNSLRRLGAKNIEAGIGCGIGFGHGFGIGLAVKPGVVHKIQSCLAQLAAKAMMKFGMSFNLPVIPKSIQSGIGMETSTRNSLGNLMPFEQKVLENFMPKDGNTSSLSSARTSVFSGFQTDLSVSGKAPLNDSHSSRTDAVISNFLQNPLLKDGESDGNEVGERLRSENNLLHLVLKHQQVIAELMQQNEKLCQILVEDLKVSPSKLRAAFSGGSKSLCIDCFECRRKQRRSR